MISIGIVTFSKRLDLFTELVTGIRRHAPDVPVLVCVNGEMDGRLDPDYLKKVLAVCSDNNLLPFVYPEFQSLSKLWNTLVINAPTEHVYLLNDDCTFSSPAIIPAIEERINEGGDGLFYAPWGWSHFVVSKTCLDELGYFDERLLGIGEEDGDMLWRFEELYGHQPSGIRVRGVSNVYAYQTATDGVDNAYGNKTLFNVLQIYGNKYRRAENGRKGMFSYPVVQEQPNERQYPYEKFRRENRKFVANTEGFPHHDIHPEYFNGMKPWHT